jgi:outer membrane protein assembly factor BamB
MDATSETFGSRVLVGHDIVVAGDYDLIGVNRRTGRRVWSFVPSDGGGAGIHLGDSAGDLLFSGSLAGALHAVSISTGRVRWSVQVGEPSETTVYSPVVQGPLVAAAFTDFGADPAGGVVVVDVATGRVLWQRIIAGSSGASGNPVFAGDVLLVASREGTIHAFRATGGDALWVLPKIERLRGEQDYRPLAVSGRTLLVGSLSGEVVAHDVRSRRLIWRRSPSFASVAFAITAHAGVAYVPYLSNQMVALRVADGAELWRLGGGPFGVRWLPWLDGPLLAVSGGQSLGLFRHKGPWGRP